MDNKDRPICGAPTKAGTPCRRAPVLGGDRCNLHGGKPASYRPICGAKTRKGTPCKNPPLENGRCRFHGGKSLGGVAHPNFKHGRYSKYLNDDDVLESYAAGLADPDLLSLRDNLALTDVRIGQILGGMPGPDVWDAMQTAKNELKTARASRDWDAMASAMTELEQLIEEGATAGVSWAEFVALSEHRRRLAESERKRAIEMRYLVAVDAVLLKVSALVEYLRQRVHDRALLNDILGETRRVFSGRGDAAGGSGSGAGRVRPAGTGAGSGSGAALPATVDAAKSHHTEP